MLHQLKMLAWLKWKCDINEYVSKYILHSHANQSEIYNSIEPKFVLY